MLLGIVSNYAQIGFKIVPKLIAPDFKKIVPNVFKFFANQVFSPNGAFGLLKSIAKVLIIGIVSYFIITSKLEMIRTLMFVDDLWFSFTFIGSLCFELIVKAVIVLLLLSIVDWFFVKWQYEEQLKMKKQEIKEEFKELYGDPFVKARLKQMYQEILSQKKQIKKVVEADLVVTNPTHYAVALKYDILMDASPRVVAKGKDHFAQKIKEVARENNIFMYENVMLARTLYAEVKINDLIPESMWEFVIVAYKLAREHTDKRARANV
jgi:flagellar biosynthetic protein FlhB